MQVFHYLLFITHWEQNDIALAISPVGSKHTENNQWIAKANIEVCDCLSTFLRSESRNVAHLNASHIRFCSYFLWHSQSVLKCIVANLTKSGK